MSSVAVERYESSFFPEPQEKPYEFFYNHNNITILQDQAIINMITTLFTEILQETDLIKNCKIGKFTSKYKPNISLREYLTRLGRCFQCSQECFIFALIYIDRLTENCSHFIVNSLNIHRLILLSIAIAAKFYDEKYFTNEYYAKVGGISLKEFNLLEVEFLHMIDYRLFVDEKLFIQYREKLTLYDDKN